MNTISLRLYPETEALYKRLLDECDAGTNGRPATADQFLNYLLEMAQNPRKIEVSKQSDLDRITELETELSKLREMSNSSLENDGRNLAEKENRITELEAELTLLQAKEPGQILDDDQLIIRVSPNQLQAIKSWQAQILEELGSEPTKSEIFVALLNKGHIQQLPK